MKNPFMDFNNIKVEFGENGKGRISHVMYEQSYNPYGTLHGGLIFTMADCAAGLAARTDGRNYVTQSSHMNFVKNVSEGTIYADSEVISRGKKMSLVHVRVTDDKGTMIADGMFDMIAF